MGVFWLASSAINLGWCVHDEHARALVLRVGVIGILAGMGMLCRGLINSLVAHEIVIIVVGSIRLLTDLLHMLEGGERIPS